MTEVAETSSREIQNTYYVR